MRCLVVAAALLAGCLESKLVTCEDGVVCPQGLVCDLAHHDCTTTGQLAACAGMPDGSSCESTTVSGECFDGVCLAPGCGNRVIEPGEQCDDGNHVSGDGCSADCTSNEQCGNGVVDTILGEQCDDGGLVSGDGCDSTCEVESAMQQELSITVYSQGSSAFDQARQVLVQIGNQQMTEWDGARWSLTPVTGFATLVFDPDHQQMLGLASSGTAVDQVGVWDGKTWSFAATSGPAPLDFGNSGSLVYDPTRHMVLLVRDNQLCFLDPVTRVWSTPVTVPFTADSHSVAVDVARGVVVALVAGSHPCCDGLGDPLPPVPPETWEWDGTTATNRGQGGVGYDSGVRVIYDPIREAVIALGGTTEYEFSDDSSTTWSDAVEMWTGTAWTVVDHMQARGSISGAAWFDAAGELSTFALQSVYAGAASDAIWQEQTSGWVRTTPLRPLGTSVPAWDIAHQVAVARDRNGSMWTWSDAAGWQLVAPSAGGPSASTVLAYDPVRGIVGIDYLTGKTWTFDGAAWNLTPITGGPVNYTSTPFYDYANHRLVAATFTGAAYVLDSAQGTAWTQLPIPTSPSSYGYDASEGTIVAYSSSGLFDYVNDQWVPSLFPGGGYSLISLTHAGAIRLVTATNGWERRFGVWHAVHGMPSSNDMVETARGALTEFAFDVAGTDSVVEHWREGPHVTESCVAGQDLDGDGLAGCADRDCWQLCTPTCPPTATCM